MTQLTSTNATQRLFPPELKMILDTDICPETARYAEAIFDTTKQSVKFLNDALALHISDLPNSTSLTTEVKTNRYAHALFNTYHHAQSVDQATSNYCSETMPLAYQFFGSFAKLALAPFNFVLTTLFTYPSDISCDKQFNNQDLAEYTLCKGINNFLAEKTLETVAQKADARCTGVSPIASEHLNSFGAYWVAATDGKINLSYNVKQAHEVWNTQISGMFCNMHPTHKDCDSLVASDSVSSFADWKKNYGSSIKRLPAALQLEINQESDRLAHKNKENDEL